MKIDFEFFYGKLFKPFIIFLRKNDFRLTFSQVQFAMRWVFYLLLYSATQVNYLKISRMKVSFILVQL